MYIKVNKKKRFAFLEEKQYKSMMHFATREEQYFKKEAESFETEFKKIKNELKNCTFTPERFRLVVYKIYNCFQ